MVTEPNTPGHWRSMRGSRIVVEASAITTIQTWTYTWKDQMTYSGPNEVKVPVKVYFKLEVIVLRMVEMYDYWERRQSIGND